jgi:haloalkane dehalogenase
MGQRFTHGDDLMTLNSHTHCYANHILAQNIRKPSILLEYPRWKDFTKEVDKQYAVIGISAFPVHLDSVMKMCRYIREKSPKTKILLGSYAAQAFAAKYDEATQKQYVDHIVLGEGVRWFRKFMGEEDIDRPIEQKLMPKCGGGPICISRYAGGNIGFFVSGLGCPGGCDFCSTTVMFNGKRIEMLTPKEFVEHVRAYYDHFPLVKNIFVIEEDHFRHHDYLHEIRDYWQKNTDVMERLDWFAFGSIDNIADFAAKYGWDYIGEIGIGSIFIGVESKFAGAHGYSKREKQDAREVFSKLHERGIRTVGAWICGWDFHNHQNMYEDLNYFVACYPTYEQLTRMSPFPGTVLYDKLKEEGRVRNVPWDDVHFWSGSQVNINLETHETLNLTEYGYKLLYETWGPSLLRRFDVTMNGYEYWSKSDNKNMREYKTKLFKQQSALVMCIISTMYHFAPNGVVRHRVDKLRQRYISIFGEPTPVQKIADWYLHHLAKRWKKKDLLDPFNQYPKEEPFKRYIYHKKNTGSPVPYLTEHPHFGRLKIRLELFIEIVRYKIIGHAVYFLGAKLLFWKSDPVIDKYVKEAAIHRTFFGF